MVESVLENGEVTVHIGKCLLFTGKSGHLVCQFAGRRVLEKITSTNTRKSSWQKTLPENLIHLVMYGCLGLFLRV
jgi:hypothetical protein